MESSRHIRGLIWQLGCLLRIASLLVPRERRKEWYARWYAEVWHWAHFLHESGRLNHATRLQLLKRVWSGFHDATWQRFNKDKVHKFVREGPRNARFCLLSIASLLLVAVVATGFAPTIRSSFSRLPYRDPERLVDLSFSNYFMRIHADSLFLGASRWHALSQTTEAVSAYSWEAASVAAAGRNVDVISAQVSPDFFDTLGVGAAMGRLFRAGDEEQCVGCIVISDHLWRYGFHHDPAIVGKQVNFRGKPATVVGVLPGRFLFISPEISLFSVTDSRASSLTTAERAGVVLRLRPGVTITQASLEFSKLVSASRVELTSLKSSVQLGTNIYLLFTLLALIGSLALLAYRLVNSSGPKVHLSLLNNYRWWMFFATKTILLLATCFVASLEGTRHAFLVFTGVIPPFAGPVCAWLFLVTTVLSLTWSLHDQCRRCRLCLKRLGHEISVGAPAYLLLDWWGTEWVCSRGHGMLHVPEMPASWLETEHWTTLDDSWKPLFESEDVKA